MVQLKECLFAHLVLEQENSLKLKQCFYKTKLKTVEIINLLYSLPSFTYREELI